MQLTKFSTLTTVSKVIQAHRKDWCYAAQQTLLNLLKKFHNIAIGRRMLNYHLADLRKEGLIKTYGRIHRREDGTICLLSSATCLTLKGAYYLYKKGNSWALRHFKALKKRYGPQKAASPQDSGENPDPVGKTPIPCNPNNPFLDQKCRSRMGLPPIPIPLKAPT